METADARNPIARRYGDLFVMLSSGSGNGEAVLKEVLDCPDLGLSKLDMLNDDVFTAYSGFLAATIRLIAAMIDSGKINSKISTEYIYKCLEDIESDQQVFC